VSSHRCSFKHRPLLLALPLLVVTAACSDTASHAIGIAGSEAVRSDGPMLADGWTIQFDSVIVVVHHPALIEQTADDPAWVRRLGVTVWDVAQPFEADASSFAIYEAGLRASSYDGFDFRIAPPSAESGYAAAAGNVDDDTLAAVVESDLALRVVGSASDGMQTIAFDWSFSTDTLRRCTIELELGAEAEGETTIELAAELLFASSAGDAPTIGFAAIAAADGDGDGTVTLDELAAAPAPNGSGAADLLAFVVQQSRVLGTVAGGSGCEIVSDSSDE
jgi:hypothetical protein